MMATLEEKVKVKDYGVHHIDLNSCIDLPIRSVVEIFPSCTF